jgi:hypothetical protein
MKADEKIAEPAPETAPSSQHGDAQIPPANEFDPLTWIVPLVCKDCGKDFSVPYRHMHAGVVFHCLHCRGSFVPTTTIDRDVHAAFEEFYAQRKRDRDEFARVGGDAAQFAQRQTRELEEFRSRLMKLAQAMSPAGKMIRRSGLRAMFT